MWKFECDKEINCALFALISPQFCWALSQHLKNSLNWVISKARSELGNGMFAPRAFWMWSWEAPRHTLGCSFTFFLGRFTLHISSLPVQCQWLDMRQNTEWGRWLEPPRRWGFIVKSHLPLVFLPPVLGPRFGSCSFTPCISSAPVLFDPSGAPSGSGSELLQPLLTAVPLLVPCRCSWSGSGRQIPWRESVQSWTTQNWRTLISSLKHDTLMGSEAASGVFNSSL